MQRYFGNCDTMIADYEILSLSKPMRLIRNRRNMICVCVCVFVLGHNVRDVIRITPGRKLIDQKMMIFYLILMLSMSIIRIHFISSHCACHSKILFLLCTLEYREHRIGCCLQHIRIVCVSQRIKCNVL